MTSTLRPSAIAMERFVSRATGLREPRLSVPVPGMPSLPDLKQMARERRAAGKPVIDQSAGDIDDVGQPMHEGLPAWIEETRDALIARGSAELRRTTGDAYGYPGHYQQQYPAVMSALTASWGITGPAMTMQTVSGRCALDGAIRGLAARARANKLEPPYAILLDPLAWSGYQPIAADLGLKLVHVPAVPGHGLTGSAQGFAEASAFAKRQGMTVIGMLPIVPSNPTGAGLSEDDLVALIEAAAAQDVPTLIDAFYSPLDPKGHAAAVPMSALHARLAPEVLGLVGMVVGETKVASSQNKTGSLIWLAPKGHEATAKAVMSCAVERLKTTNAYPRPQEAVVAAALHTFPGGIQKAMGARYLALDATRNAMAATCDELGIPLSIGGSFYGTAALVDPEGTGLLRDGEGRPLTDARSMISALVDRYGLVGAPGGMFSPAPDAAVLVRLTAAVTPADVARVGEILRELLEKSRG